MFQLKTVGKVFYWETTTISTLVDPNLRLAKKKTEYIKIWWCYDWKMLPMQKGRCNCRTRASEWVGVASKASDRPWIATSKFSNFKTRHS